MTGGTTCVAYPRSLRQSGEYTGFIRESQINVAFFFAMVLEHFGSWFLERGHLFSRMETDTSCTLGQKNFWAELFEKGGTRVIERSSIQTIRGLVSVHLTNVP